MKTARPAISCDGGARFMGVLPCLKRQTPLAGPLRQLAQLAPFPPQPAVAPRDIAGE